MIRNRIWVLLLFIIGIFVFLFSAKTFFEIYQFISLADLTPAFEIQPQIVRSKKRGYTLLIDYSYEVEGRRYRRSQTLKTKNYYKNRWVAQEALLDNLNKNHVVSFVPDKKIYRHLNPLAYNALGF